MRRALGVLGPGLPFLAFVAMLYGGEWLCADALAADLDTDDRATTLALVAMARHALLLSGRPQLDQAIALDPDAALVSEAVRLLDGGWDSALAAYDQWVRRAAPDD